METMFLYKVLDNHSKLDIYILDIYILDIYIMKNVGHHSKFSRLCLDPHISHFMKKENFYEYYSIINMVNFLIMHSLIDESIQISSLISTIIQKNLKALNVKFLHFEAPQNC